MTAPRKRSWEEKWAHDSALLPYPCEPNEDMQQRLDVYIRRCVPPPSGCFLR
jgi:proteasome activator subunit 4